jgi:hypothetical protein
MSDNSMKYDIEQISADLLKVQTPSDALAVARRYRTEASKAAAVGDNPAVKEALGYYKFWHDFATAESPSAVINRVIGQTKAGA